MPYHPAGTLLKPAQRKEVLDLVFLAALCKATWAEQQAYPSAAHTGAGEKSWPTPLDNTLVTLGKQSMDYLLHQMFLDISLPAITWPDQLAAVAKIIPQIF